MYRCCHPTVPTCILQTPWTMVYASAGLEYPRVQVGHRYVLAINRMPPPGFATLTPALVYVTMMCGGVERDVLQRNGMLAAFGRGRPPGR